MKQILMVGALIAFATTCAAVAAVCSVTHDGTNAVPTIVQEGQPSAASDLFAELKSVEIDGCSYEQMTIDDILRKLEDRANDALASHGKESVNISTCTPMQLFRNVRLSRMSIYDAISNVAEAAGCVMDVYDSRGISLEPKVEVDYAEGGIDIKAVRIPGKTYVQEAFTNIVQDLWRRSNDALFESKGCTVYVSYPYIGTKLDVDIPAGNILDAFRAVARSVRGEASFDGFWISLDVECENTEVARLMKRVRIDDLDIPAGTSLGDAMESVRRRINLHCASGQTDLVEFVYLGAQTNETIAGVSLSGVSAFEAISKICDRTHRDFWCDPARNFVVIGLTSPEYDRRFRRLHFPGGRYSGESISAVAFEFFNDLKANLERNDLCPVGLTVSGGSREAPTTVEVEPGETWAAIECFARKADCSVEYSHGLLRFRSKEVGRAEEGEAAR
ncbi:MAG: hypothetical protein K6G91_01475 [Kiritimatiellae bacterium]|nr:hypothetical protein [Kiritimatiellia bacterium]